MENRCDGCPRHCKNGYIPDDCEMLGVWTHPDDGRREPSLHDRIAELEAEVARLTAERDTLNVKLGCSQAAAGFWEGRCSDAQDQAAQLRAALEAWERWEADWIMTSAAWDTPDGLPRLTQALYDRLVPTLQEQRNAALSLPAGRVGAAAIRVAEAVDAYVSMVEPLVGSMDAWEKVLEANGAYRQALAAEKGAP